LGHIEAELEISNLAGTKARKVKALADTGATLTVIPQRLADELGLERLGTAKVATGAGELELRQAVARLAIGERETVQDVLVSELIERVLLGVVTLEAMGLALDPLTGELKERGLLLYQAASFDEAWKMEP
jgi:clan AA aspartic protease